MNEMFDVVDALDRVVGQESRANVHKKNLFHRAVHVFIVLPSGNFIIQQRSSQKDIDPYLWTSSCSGHVDAGEIYESAAVRECLEELGIDIKAQSFKEIFRCSPCDETGNEFVRVYTLFYGGAFTINKEEILQIRELRISEIENLLKDKPEEFSSSFRHLFPLVRKVLFK